MAAAVVVVVVELVVPIEYNKNSGVYTMKLSWVFFFFRFMYWFSSTDTEHSIMRVPMYGESEVSILRNLPVDTHFAIDYYDRKIYWTQVGDYFSEIRSYKLDTDDIPDDEVIRSLSR